MITRRDLLTGVGASLAWGTVGAGCSDPPIVPPIDADQVNDIMEGRPPRPPKPTGTPKPPPGPHGSAPAPAATTTPAQEA